MAYSGPSSPTRRRLADLGTGLAAVCLSAVLAGGLLVWLGTRGPIGSVEPAVGSIALEVAGADRLAVVGYLGIGLTRVYVTLLPLALFLAGVGVALIDRRWSTPAAVLLGVASAGTLTVLSGCSCASGSVGFLAEWTARTVANGAAPLAV